MSYDRLTVESFVLNTKDGESLHYELDDDLLFNMRKAGYIESPKGYVLVTLGVDGEPCNVIRTDHMAGTTTIETLGAAAETLRSIIEQLACIHSVDELHQLEKNAFDIGVDAERAGLVPQQSEGLR